MDKTGNSEMCGVKHSFVGGGKHCQDCGHLAMADCHFKNVTSEEIIQAQDIGQQMATEVHRAREIYSQFNSSHEGYAVLLEEVLELQAEVFKKSDFRSPDMMREEAIQVGAMAIRFIQDCC